MLPWRDLTPEGWEALCAANWTLYLCCVQLHLACWLWEWEAQHPLLPPDQA